MSKKQIVLRLKNTFNKGDFLGAKIYADARNNQCDCGGKFIFKMKFEGLDYPVCDLCKNAPTKFLINAKVEKLDGTIKWVKIRYMQNGKRLGKIYDCLSTLDRVKEEIDLGTFDVRKYDSKSNRDYFLFNSISKEYLEFHTMRLSRGEISPSGFKNKRVYIEHLNKYFSKMDVNKINIPMIEKFKNSFTEKFRTRDLCLMELRTLLKHAFKMEIIKKVPDFSGLINQSQKREEIITYEDAFRVIENIGDGVYKDMLNVLLAYPLRPGELRALQWRDVDFKNKTVKIKRHFSCGKIIEGRKSLKSGDKSEIVYPLIERIESIFLKQMRSLREDDFIFRGKVGKFVSEKALLHAWNVSAKKLKIKSQMYEIRHALLTKISKDTNGNINLMLKASGHTNIQTLVSRYIRDKSDMRDLFH